MLRRAAPFAVSLRALSRCALLLSALLFSALALTGCGANASESSASASGSTDAERGQPAARTATDRAYLGGSVWDDGQAEIAFYEVQRTKNQYGAAAEQTFPVGTYLVKHDFDVSEMSKAKDGPGVEAFKYALFYEFESRSYQYKRNWVVNVARADVRPLKASFTSFDWCSNIYEELAFREDGTVRSLFRSDDYGNREATFSDAPDTYALASSTPRRPGP